MKIVCAHSVTAGKEAFSCIGGEATELVIVPEAEIANEHVRGADALITRSKTKVTRELVKGSGLQFYATCTAGTDHVDTSALADEGIAWADAKGCNANAVSEYVTASLLYFASRYGLDLREQTLGIVGHGHVGRAVEAKARTLGMQVLLNDPPVEHEGGEIAYVSLDEILAESTILSLHVPLVEDGPWPTRQLLNTENLRGCRPQYLINACRGEVIETAALLERSPFRAMVLDVWDPEPAYPTALFDRVDFGSPHVAGHSVEGKIMGTAIAYEKLCAHFERVPSWDPAAHLPPLDDVLDLSEAARIHPERALRAAVATCVNLRTDHNLMAMWPADERAALFTRRRRSYPLRREFGACRVRVPEGFGELRTLLDGLGFGAA